MFGFGSDNNKIKLIQKNCSCARSSRRLSTSPLGRCFENAIELTSSDSIACAHILFMSIVDMDSLALGLYRLNVRFLLLSQVFLVVWCPHITSYNKEDPDACLLQALHSLDVEERQASEPPFEHVAPYPTPTNTPPVSRGTHVHFLEGTR